MFKSSRESLWILLSHSNAQFALQFFASLVVARLLTPNEFGIVSVAMVLIGIGHTFRDFGCGDYLVQERDLTVARIGSAVTVTFAMAWLIATVIFFGASSVADFYAEPGLKLAMQLLAVNFLLLPFGTVTMAYLRRIQEFERLAWVRTLSTLVQVSVTLVLVFFGFSYYSMIWGSIAASAFSVAAAFQLRPIELVIRPGVRGVRSVLSFGMYHALSTLMTDLGKGAPDLVLGRLIGMEAVAFFGRAVALVEIFNKVVMEAVGFLALPHFSLLHRSGASLAEAYIRVLPYLLVLAWPFFLFVGIMALPIIRALYGDQWDLAGPLVRYLIIGEMFVAPFLLLTAALVSSGRIAVDTRRNVVTTGLRVLALLALASFGLEIVAAGFMFASVIGAIYSFFVARGVLGFSSVDFFRSMISSAFVTVAAGVGPLYVVAQMDVVGAGAFLALMAAIVSSGLGWIIAIYSIGHPARVELDRAWQHLLRKGKA